MNYLNNNPFIKALCKPNGENWPITNVVEGNGVVVFYSEDGIDTDRDIYKNGELIDD